METWRRWVDSGIDTGNQHEICMSSDIPRKLGNQLTLYPTVGKFAGFTPLRTNTDDKVTGGNRRWWELHALQPQLGLFHGRESKIPYDFDDVLSLIAPRPCLITAPKRDRFADHADVVRCVNRAGAAWKKAGKPRNITLATPNDISRFQTDQQDRFLEWAKRAVQQKK